MELPAARKNVDPYKENQRLDLSVGGQALIEGVMIRAPRAIAIALREPSGSVLLKSRDYVGLSRRFRGLGLPVVRGIVSFAEMLAIGLDALTYAANVAAREPGDGNSGDDVGMGTVDVAVLIISLALGVGLFVFLPLAVASLLGLADRAGAYNGVAGGIRILLFLAYLWVIGRFADIERVFQYHGAEHKAVSAFEAGIQLSVNEVKPFSRFHPRCGTSFVLLVVVLAIGFYALADTVYLLITGSVPEITSRFLVHLACLPIVAGIGFEILKLTGRNRNARWARVAAKPGLWLQKLTTREPDDRQLGVAIAAVRAAVGLPTGDEPA